MILPWTEDFAQTYQEMYQEDILEKLPELIWEKQTEAFPRSGIIIMIM